MQYTFEFWNFHSSSPSNAAVPTIPDIGHIRSFAEGFVVLVLLSILGFLGRRMLSQVAAPGLQHLRMQFQRFQGDAVRVHRIVHRRIAEEMAFRLSLTASGTDGFFA